MMGRQSSDQDRLFYSFDLEAIVPTDHLLRGIGTVLDRLAAALEIMPTPARLGPG